MAESFTRERINPPIVEIVGRALDSIATFSIDSVLVLPSHELAGSHKERNRLNHEDHRLLHILGLLHALLQVDL